MKKVLALLLAATLAFGMITGAFAAAGQRIRGVYGDALGSSLNTVDGQWADPDNLTLQINSVLRVYLSPDMFEWTADGQPAGTTQDPMYLSNLSGLNVKGSYKVGGDYFRAPELKYDSQRRVCYIELALKKGIVLTSAADIDGKITVTYKNTKSELPFSGVIDVTPCLVTEPDTSAWIDRSNYLLSTVNKKDLEIHFLTATEKPLAYLNMTAGTKYYLWIEEDVLPKDEDYIAKYKTLEYVYHAYYSKTTKSANPQVVFDLDDNYYVYDQNLQYLGMSDDKLPLRDVYYFSTEKLAVPSGNTDGGGGGGSSRSSGNDVYGSTTSPSGGITAAAPTSDITADNAVSTASKAAADAKASGATTATARFVNPGAISREALAIMPLTANMPVTLRADSMTQDGKAVDVRLMLDPAASVKDLNLSGSTQSQRAGQTQALFAKSFRNRTWVVSLGQQGSFGQTVEIAAKLNLGDANPKNLCFYTYDRASNTYHAIPSPQYWVDANGYLHLVTTQAGDIVVSEGPLAKR